MQVPLRETCAGIPPPRCALASSDHREMDEQLVRVEFRVPVWVHVDLEQGEVVSVHVDDVAVEGPVAFSTYAGGEVDAARRKAAEELTRNNESWPAWTMGFDHT